MIGPRVGLVAGPRVGYATGLGEDELTPTASGIAGVTRDSQSLVYSPASGAEWTSFMAAAGLATGNPRSAWLLQDAAGNPADVVDTCPLTATTVSYQQPVTGWSRLAMRFADASAGSVRNSSAQAPNPSLTSTLIGAWVDFGATPAATRDVMGVTSNALVQMLATGKLQVVGGAATQTANVMGTARRPVILRTNITAGTITLATDAEIVAGTFAAPASTTLVTFGRVAVLTPPIGFMYAFQFTGTSAELTDAQLRTLLQTAGWAVAW